MFKVGDLVKFDVNSKSLGLVVKVSRCDIGVHWLNSDLILHYYETHLFLISNILAGNL